MCLRGELLVSPFGSSRRVFETNLSNLFKSPTEHDSSLFFFVTTNTSSHELQRPSKKRARKSRGSRRPNRQSHRCSSRNRITSPHHRTFHATRLNTRSRHLNFRQRQILLLAASRRNPLQLAPTKPGKPLRNRRSKIPTLQRNRTQHRPSLPVAYQRTASQTPRHARLQRLLRLVFARSHGPTNPPSLFVPPHHPQSGTGTNQFHLSRNSHTDHRSRRDHARLGKRSTGGVGRAVG